MVILLLLIFTPPILSLDIGAYVLGAKSFITTNSRAYLDVISAASSWSLQMNNVWWLDYPTIYGPIFLIIVSPSLLLSSFGFIAVILGYKFIVFLSFVFLLYIFRIILKNRKLNSNIFYLLALNPAILINWVLEGHNDIFIALGLLGLIFFLDKKNEVSGWISIFSAIFVKYTAIVFVPVLFVYQNKIDLKRIFIFLFIATGAFLLFFSLSGTTPLAVKDNLIFLNRCFYKCSPVVSLAKTVGAYQNLIRLIIFTLVYIWLFWRYLYKNTNYLKFIFWTAMSLFFIQIAWLTPWYPTIIIPIGLLINEKKYLYLVILITWYSLLHYIGL